MTPPKNHATMWFQCQGNKETSTMQTFLPTRDFATSLMFLDPKRLGKQRVEAMQILKALFLSEGGWAKHPATLMWKGYEPALMLYYNTCLDEWTGRGYKNNMHHAKEVLGKSQTSLEMPHWLGNEEFHKAHKSNLLRKDPMWYGEFGWKVPRDLPYIWPKGKEGKR